MEVNKSTSGDMVSHMTQTFVFGEVDVLTADDAKDLASVQGPCVSVYMPTHRFGGATVVDAGHLSSLISQASKKLQESGTPKKVIKKILDPLRSLASDTSYWQHQSGGLALFAARGWFSSFRLPMSVSTDVFVGSTFRIRQLIPLLTGDGHFYLLTLSQNTIQLFRGTQFTLGQITANDIPKSMKEALAHEDPERQLQSRSSGGDTVQFHGHGTGDEIDKAAVERFLRAVDQGVVKALGSSRIPLVLACVPYYTPLYRSVTRYPVVHAQSIEGNPEHLRADELHAAAWAIIKEMFNHDRSVQADRYRRVAGTGITSSSLDEIATASTTGRVDVLFINSSITELPENDATLVNDAVLNALFHGASIYEAPEVFDNGEPAIALLRF